MLHPEEAPPLSLVTFNLLAPCYKRLFHPSGQERRDREQSHPSLWRPRLDALLQLLLTLSPAPDVIALQEVWFHPPFLARLEAALAPHFHLFYARRPCPKQDGLATLVRRRAAALHPVRPPALVAAFPLADSDRVGLAVSLVLASGRPLLVLNAHLTFPHCIRNRRTRLEQADALVRFVADAQLPTAPALLLGDMNGDSDSRVCKRLADAGFHNCYVAVNGSAAAPATHRNHINQQVFVDHIFLRPPPPHPHQQPARRRRRPAERQPRQQGPLQSAERGSSPVAIRDAVNPTPDKAQPLGYIRPVSSVVYPERFPTHIWPLEYHVSDHRPVGVQFAIASCE